MAILDKDLVERRMPLLMVFISPFSQVLSRHGLQASVVRQTSAVAASMALSVKLPQVIQSLLGSPSIIRDRNGIITTGAMALITRMW